VCVGATRNNNNNNKAKAANVLKKKEIRHPGRDDTQKTQKSKCQWKQTSGHESQKGLETKTKRLTDRLGQL
jgi:hypothetical protein